MEDQRGASVRMQKLFPPPPINSRIRKADGLTIEIAGGGNNFVIKSVKIRSGRQVSRGEGTFTPAPRHIMMCCVHLLITLSSCLS